MKINKSDKKYTPLEITLIILFGLVVSIQSLFFLFIFLSFMFAISPAITVIALIVVLFNFYQFSLAGTTNPLFLFILFLPCLFFLNQLISPCYPVIQFIKCTFHKCFITNIHFKIVKSAQ